MTLFVARGLARLTALVLSTTLAVGGLAVAVFSVQGDSPTLSLPSLAGHMRLDDLLARVGMTLAGLEAAGSIAKVAAVAGAGTVVLGLLLLFGVFGRTRERLVVLRSDDAGTIGARRRAVAQVAVAVGEQSRDVLRATATTAARRRRGGRLRVKVYLAESADGAAVTEATRVRVQALAAPFSLRLRIRAVPRRGGGVA
ncbi:MAG: hypothetical protein QOG94_1906 [Solirubrobacteraceae bacterium]|nr:hypothetical protein [Solirubrobacteraceae bacterium]